MQTIGERLEEARKRKGITIREAAEATKIRGDYLQRFEGNHYDINLPEIYVRGFLRSYAIFLKVPADKILADYRALGLATAEARPRTPSREVYGRMDISFASANGKPSGKQGEADLGTSPAESTGGEDAAGSRPRQFARIGTSLPSGPYFDPRMISKISMILGGALLVLLLIWGLGKLLGGSSTPGVSAKPAAVATPAAEPSITLIALDTVRVKVVQKGDNLELFQGTLVRGETRTVPKRGPLYVTATAGKNLEIEINGKRYPLPFTGYDRAEIQ